LLRALSRQVWRISKDGGRTTSPGNVSHHLLSSQGESVSLYPVLNPSVSMYACCLLSSHHVVLSRAWLQLLHDMPVSTSLLLCGPPEAVSPPRWTNRGPTASPQWGCAHLAAHHPCRAFPEEQTSQAVPAWIPAGELPSHGRLSPLPLTEMPETL